MAREVRIKYDAWANFSTIVLTGLGSAANTGNYSGIVANTLRRIGARIFLKMWTGTGPSDGSVFTLFAVYGTAEGSNERTDGRGSGHAEGITVVNALPLGALTVSATNNTAFQDMFDTAPHGPLPHEFGIIVGNKTGAASHASNVPIAKYSLYLNEIQNEA